jgi:hypothetical protein
VARETWEYTISYVFVTNLLIVILFAWIGNADLHASEARDPKDQGPILTAVSAFPFDAVHLLSDFPLGKARAFVRWLEQRSTATAHLHLAKLTSPTNFEEIYRVATLALETVSRSSPTAPFTFHLSPGTPAMAAIWLLLAKTRYPARLLESSREQGVKEVSIPFELSAEFTPDALKNADETLTRLMQGLPPE